MRTVKLLLLLGLLLVITLSITNIFAVVPFGGSVTPIQNETAPADVAGTHNAIAGNVTEITITAFSTTQSWQGYYGNVSGTVQLADSTDNVFYNWSLASPEGEVYAANNTVLWTNIQCFNFSANGTFGNDNSTAGATSQGGMNLTQIEASFSIVSDDVDGVNETFSLTGAGTHDEFFTNNLQFSEGECRNTRVYSSAGSGVTNQFEEVLLYDPNTRIPVYASILDEDVLGFDSAAHDFEMLVLEDGHATNIATTTYYFYVELE